MNKEKKARILEQLALINDACDVLKHTHYIRAREIKIAASNIEDVLKDIQVDE